MIASRLTDPGNVVKTFCSKYSSSNKRTRLKEFSCSRSLAETSTGVVATRRSLLIGALLSSTSLLELPACAEYRIESLIPEGFDFGVVKDPILAYEFLYPRQYLSGKRLSMAFYRKPVRYTLAAQQSVEGRQRIVCGLGALADGVILTVGVGPPPEKADTSDILNWKPTTIANAVLSDQSASRLVGNRRVPIASIENATVEDRDGVKYWTYESILVGSPTTLDSSEQTYRHSLSVTSIRNADNGTPFLYTLTLGCPQNIWEDLNPLFNLCASSFRLSPTTTQYIAPDRADFFIF